MNLKSPREYVQFILHARGNQSVRAHEVVSALMREVTAGPASKMTDGEGCLCADCMLSKQNELFDEVRDNMKVVVELYHKVSTNTLLAKFRLSSLLRASVRARTPAFYQKLCESAFVWPASSELHMPANRWMRKVAHKHVYEAKPKAKAIVMEKPDDTLVQ